MAGPVEILIVIGVFGVIGTYLWIARRFIRESELATPECQPRPASKAPESNLRKIEAHAH